ncbi:MAG: LPD7 domain-containing protein [Psittacicella sp.]
MLVRVKGSNSGIVNYLLNGNKAGRSLNRIELDNRMVLLGDINNLNTVINSIPNNKQERYLHITLSFKKSEVEIMDLKSIAEDYENMLMSAYKKDEYCFYAEAHLPKTKKEFNYITKEENERKTHLHIVIPEINLVNNKVLHPFGLVRTKEKEAAAFQEKINYKYNLESPFNTPISLENLNSKRDILVKHGAKILKDSGNTFKKEIFEIIKEKDINSFLELGEILKDNLNIREIKLKEYKDDEPYYIVKLKNESNFTHLKEQCFKKDFIENNIVKRERPTEKDCDKTIKIWKDYKCFEPLYTSNASKKDRETYFKSTNKTKEKILNDYKIRIKRSSESRASSETKSTLNFYKNRSSTDSFSNTNGQKIMEFESLSEIRIGMPGMSQSDLDGYTKWGDEQSSGSTKRESNEMLLPRIQSDKLGQQNSRDSESLRWTDNSSTRARDYGLIVAQTDKRMTENNYEIYKKPSTNFTDSLIKYANTAINIDNKAINHIKNLLEPKFLFDVLKDRYAVNKRDYSYKRVENGSYRIKHENRNYNLSDFLTKYMHLELLEAQSILLEAWDRKFIEMDALPFDKEGYKELKEATQEQYKNSKINFLYSRDLKESDFWFEYSKSVRNNIVYKQIHKDTKKQNINHKNKEEDMKLFQLIKNKFNKKHKNINVEKLDKLFSPNLHDISNMSLEEIKKELRENTFIDKNITYNFAISITSKNVETLDKFFDALQDFEEYDIRFSNKALENKYNTEINQDANMLFAGSEFVESRSSKKSEFKSNLLNDLIAVPDPIRKTTLYKDKLGAKIFLESEKSIKVINTSLESVSTALELAAEKFGSVKIRGTSEFQDTVMRAALSNKDLKIVFEPQDFHDTYLTKLKEQEKNEQANELEKSSINEGLENVENEANKDESHESEKNLKNELEKSSINEGFNKSEQVIQYDEPDVM